VGQNSGEILYYLIWSCQSGFMRSFVNFSKK